MAGGFAAKGSNANVSYNGKLTVYTFLVTLVAASGGLLFGYDIGITGGVEAMASFQQKFFPDVYALSAVDGSTASFGGASEKASSTASK